MAGVEHLETIARLALVEIQHRSAPPIFAPRQDRHWPTWPPVTAPCTRAALSTSSLLAGQVSRYGIQVHAVTPGPVGREMTAIVPERTHAGLTETIALRRFGSAGDVADLVAFLLSDESSVMTGTVREVRSPIFAGAP